MRIESTVRSTVRLTNDVEVRSVTACSLVEEGQPHWGLTCLPSTSSNYGERPPGFNVPDVLLETWWGFRCPPEAPFDCSPVPRCQFCQSKRPLAFDVKMTLLDGVSDTTRFYYVVPISISTSSY